MDSFSESFDFSNNRLTLHRCYECDSQVTIVATSLPTCPNCYSEFVEEIEVDTSNYIFDDSPPSVSNGEEEFDTEIRESEVVNRVQTMLQQLLSSNSSSFVIPEEEGEDPYYDLNEYDNETDNDSEGTEEDIADREDIFTTILNMDDTTHSEPRNSSLPQNFSNFIQHLLEGANASMGGANPLWNLLELHGEPGDYVFGEQGLDNVITQLMEQPGKNIPTPASEDTINKLPLKLITQDQIDIYKECTVCKDDFITHDAVTHLPCQHLFHHECIRPWLLLNGTCPVCRYSLITKETPRSKDSAETVDN